jgi:hypothetical protein
VCEFLRAKPAHFYIFGVFLWFLICVWRGFGLFGGFLVNDLALFLVYGG